MGYTDSKAKGQSSLEFLATYSWAIIIISLLVVFMFYFIQSTQQFASTECQFAYGLHCSSIEIYSNNMYTNLSIHLNNSQQYLILNPNVNFSISQYGNVSGPCTPSKAGESNGITCNAIYPNPIKAGSTVSGVMYVNVTVCVSGNTKNCQPSQQQTYIGNFSATVATRSKP